MDEIALHLDQARALSHQCLLANGCDEANAAAVTEVMLAAEGDGCPSHGLFRLPGYVTALRSGRVDGRADPSVERIAGAVVRVDGRGAFAPLALARGRQPLIDAARENGIAALSLVDIFHFAALWPEVEAVAGEGFCALAVTSSRSLVAPAGGAKALFGTNPMAFGWPRKDGPPMVFDQAVAVMAQGEVMLAARDGHELPPGVALDSEGQPTIDAKAAVDGVLLPFGGYKGSAIGMMIELLAAGLLGENFAYEASEQTPNDGGPGRGGELIIAMDPARFGDAAGWLAHSEQFFEKMLAQDGVRLPGARRHANRARIKLTGFSIPAALHTRILQLIEAA
ncbi:MAG: Ldh family oxidoreductase [Alphaproteobacteria bacterium]|jgi:delta1-piperideine-2-carboxylate reductase|nr:Ldh family oxidoreductase [Alphaproteobacteria bacterium]